MVDVLCCVVLPHSSVVLAETVEALNYILSVYFSTNMGGVELITAKHNKELTKMVSDATGRAEEIR